MGVKNHKKKAGPPYQKKLVRRFCLKFYFSIDFCVWMLYICGYSCKYVELIAYAAGRQRHRLCKWGVGWNARASGPTGRKEFRKSGRMDEEKYRSREVRIRRSKDQEKHGSGEARIKRSIDEEKHGSGEVQMKRSTDQE